MEKKTLARRIYDAIVRAGGQLHLKQIYKEVKNDVKVEEGKEVAEETLRCAIYRDKNFNFDRIGKGLYAVAETITNENGEEEHVKTLIVEGDGRTLECIPTSSADAIITDHPWADKKAHKSGNQKNFSEDYEETCFRYNIEDFKAKSRVLKDGAFLVEFLPEESATNWEYIDEIKQMAKKCGLEFYAKVPWEKVGVSVNTGRKAKYGDDVLFFTKGKPRRLSPKGKPYMTTSMLPSIYKYEPVKPSEKIHQAEKPLGLYQAIIEAVTMPGEVIIDQFAGSGKISEAAMSKGRFSIAFELLKENIEKIVKRLNAVKILPFEENKNSIPTKSNITNEHLESYTAPISEKDIELEVKDNITGQLGFIF